MLIDWFTVIAQIVNFLILVYLLKRFLFKPVLDAVDKREKRIASQLADAARQKKAAAEEHLHYDQMNQDLEKNRADYLKKALARAEAERKKMLAAARQEYEDLRKKFDASLQAERNSYEEATKHHIQEEVLHLTRKTLSDLADIDLESHIVKVFLEKISNLDAQAKKQLCQAMNQAGDITIKSAFNLNAEQEKAIGNVIDEIGSRHYHIVFHHSSEEIGGVQLLAGGYKISWTISEYLDALQDQLNGYSDQLPGSMPD